MLRCLSRTVVLMCGLALCGGFVFAKTSVPAKSSGTKQVSSGKHVRYKRWAKRRSWKSRGQKAIDKQRALEIQMALIRENYLRGEPTGVWDTRSKQAMQKFQADRGWQTRVVPDSRALIELGLGPKHENIINPETAMTPSALAGSAANGTGASARQR
jgi:hypothetical protein